MELSEKEIIKSTPYVNDFIIDIHGIYLDITEPIVITPDKVIVSGHQRVRACKELGIDEINCDIHLYKRIKELERIYGIEHGNNQYGDEKNSYPKTQTQLASDMGMDVRTLQNYKLLADMIPELSDLVDTGYF